MNPSFLVWTVALCCQPRSAPVYSAASVVHSATNRQVLAPNTFGTIYGKGLSWSTRAIGPADLLAGFLPPYLLGTGVTVFVDGFAAPVFYVSPDQINFLVPNTALPEREAKLRVNLDGISGPEVNVRLKAVAPGLFLRDMETVAAVKLDGRLLSDKNLATGGEDVVLFATGLGPLIPEPAYMEVARSAAPLARRAEFQLLLNGTPVEDKRIRYVGAAPGFAGLYQINLWLPEGVTSWPEVRIGVAGELSPVGVRLPVK
ncbi:MAG: hypothetical protein JNK48_18045 [Bryobacterales bacterium]|nr:hypothetical protein [Bryobacterales bacterium]